MREEYWDYKNLFWLEFSQLVHKYLQKADPEDRHELQMMLGDVTSVYGIADLDVCNPPEGV